jgi:hypothetical protein
MAEITNFWTNPGRCGGEYRGVRWCASRDANRAWRLQASIGREGPMIVDFDAPLGNWGELCTIMDVLDGWLGKYGIIRDARTLAAERDVDDE